MSQESLHILECFGVRDQLRETNSPIQITISLDTDGKRIVGCSYLGENGFCNAPGKPNTSIRPSRISCPHLRPVHESNIQR
jgi:hypothetical protein